MMLPIEPTGIEIMVFTRPIERYFLPIEPTGIEMK